MTANVPWKAYQNERNANTVRVKYNSGESVLMPRNAYASVVRQIQNDVPKSVTPPGNTSPSLGAKAFRAGVNIGVNTAKGAVHAVTGSGDLNKPGAPTSGLGKLIVHPVDTLSRAIPATVNAVGNAFMDQSNQNG